MMKATDTESCIYERRKVYDLLLRLIHAWIGSTILVLLSTAWATKLLEHGATTKAAWMIHVFAGYGLIGGFGVRLFWGFVGPKHARFSDLWHPAAWWQVITLRNFRFAISERYGHHPLAAGAYLGFYGLVALMSATGLALAAIEHASGPLLSWLFDAVWLEDWFKAPHEVGSFLVIGFIVLHLSAMILHERVERTPISQAMISGYQYRIRNSVITGLALLSLGYGSPVFGSAEDASSVERGRKLYLLERTVQGKRVSCASCHTPDPRAIGRTRANKEIKPLAPSANPERFTDPAKVEKWFRRNCNDVLERECTAREKGDFITYLRSVK